MKRYLLSMLIFILGLSLLAGCGPILSNPSSTTLTITISVDKKKVQVTVPFGSSVQQVIDISKIPIGPLDRIDPPGYTLLSTSQTIKITRVREEFTVEETPILFESQNVRNESLPEGQTMLIQAGVNGLRQTTYRILYEDDEPRAKTVFKVVTLKEAKPEIVMIGVQAPFTSFNIPGVIAYMTAGNAWIMEGSTGNRKPIITSGDLDGRIFKMSPDHRWLLFSRKPQSEQADEINSLWIVSLEDSNSNPVDLSIKNVLHFADWSPTQNLTIAYSTVEPRSAAPGWQANNDLHILTLDATGHISSDQEIIAPNSGGIYGWWGTYYRWSPNGKRMAYSRPDSIGLVDQKNQTLVPIYSITPYLTKADWAWVPGIDWNPDNNTIYFTNHLPVSSVANPEESPLFAVSALAGKSLEEIDLLQPTGMFAYPSISPKQNDGSYWIAYLQAIFPEQSDSSRYQLMLADRDGSNQRLIFPSEGMAGLDPQKVIWSPAPEDNEQQWLAFLYQSNLWLYNFNSGQTKQVTSDGLISLIDWK